MENGDSAFSFLFLIFLFPAVKFVAFRGHLGQVGEFFLCHTFEVELSESINILQIMYETRNMRQQADVVQM